MRTNKKQNIEKLRRKAAERTKKKAKESLSSRDRVIISAVKTMDVIDKTSNALAESASDWFGIYWPELKTSNVDDFLERAANGERPASSMGADLSEKDIKIIKSFIESVRSLRAERREIEEYLGNAMKESAPNTSAVCGPVIGARLIASAGGLRRLAEFPSSTVQILGAEKALFAHLKKGVKPPKYGIIFQHPAVHSAPPEKRGKVARKLSAKISIAAKVDYFKGEFVGERLAKELGEELKKL
ncbi:MAG: hypothetical protein QXO69_02710 [archaeon]